MVQLEEVQDAELDQAQPGPVGDDYDSDDFVDTGMLPHYSRLLLLLLLLPSSSKIHPTPKMKMKLKNLKEKLR